MQSFHTTVTESARLYGDTHILWLQRPDQLASSRPGEFLMTYIGDAGRAAPTLNEVRLERPEAEDLFLEVLRNIELMLEFDMIHGDLSAYNILYWQGEITLIDFPQVIDSQSNSKAYFILERDITRVCQYFKRQGVKCDSRAIMRDLWKRYIEKDPFLVTADESRKAVDENGFLLEEAKREANGEE